jgi:hypothetical protein
VLDHIVRSETVPKVSVIKWLNGLVQIIYLAQGQVGLILLLRRLARDDWRGLRLTEVMAKRFKIGGLVFFEDPLVAVVSELQCFILWQNYTGCSVCLGVKCKVWNRLIKERFQGRLLFNYWEKSCCLTHFFFWLPLKFLYWVLSSWGDHGIRYTSFVHISLFPIQMLGMGVENFLLGKWGGQEVERIGGRLGALKVG